jgi:hypothetical protein
MSPSSSSSMGLLVDVPSPARIDAMRGRWSRRLHLPAGEDGEEGVDDGGGARGVVFDGRLIPPLPDGMYEYVKRAWRLVRNEPHDEETADGDSWTSTVTMADRS